MASGTAKICLVLCTIILLSSGAAAISLGISPSVVEFKKVLKGGYAEKTATISTSSPQSLDITIGVSGQIKDWVTVGESQFILDANSRKAITIKVQPPTETPNGVYSGSIIASAKPTASASGTMGAVIVTAVEMQVSAEVTGEQIEDFAVSSLVARDTEEGQPLEFNIKVDNLGNTRITPAVHIDVQDKNGQKLKSLDYSQTQILPTKSEPIIIKAPNDLPIGSYDAKVAVSVGGKKVERAAAFGVLERGSLRLQGELITIKTDKVWAKVGEAVELSATFENTGQLVAPAVFKGKAYIDGNLVDLIEGDEIDVPVGETVDLKSYYTPKKAGRYKIVGWVYYSKKTTKENFVVLNVQEAEVTSTTAPERPQSGENAPTALYAVIGVLALAVVVLGLKTLRGGK